MFKLFGRKNVEPVPAEPVAPVAVEQPPYVWDGTVNEIVRSETHRLYNMTRSRNGHIASLGREGLIELSREHQQRYLDLRDRGCSKAELDENRFTFQFVDAACWVCISPPWVDCICGEPRQRYDTHCRNCGRPMGRMAERELAADAQEPEIEPEVEIVMPVPVQPSAPQPTRSQLTAMHPDEV